MKWVYFSGFSGDYGKISCILYDKNNNHRHRLPLSSLLFLSPSIRVCVCVNHSDTHRENKTAQVNQQ